MSFVSELQPTTLWGHFDTILTIPRGSKKEEAARAHVVAIADGAGLDHVVDSVGNVVVRKPGTAGREGAPIIVLQAHLDMVQEKNSETEFDFDTEAIRPVMDGEYLTADGTTLGSDNGIGVAAMLAILEADDIAHGPLEFLFTIDEETGLTGAGGLAEDLLQGRRLINLDSEEEGVLTIGCAGGADTHLTLPVNRTGIPGDWQAISIRVEGMKGGHSGVDIHLQRGNAVRLLGRVLYSSLLREELRVASFKGGNAHNAIPREADAVIVAPAGAAETIRGLLACEFEAIKAELQSIDPGFAWKVGDVGLPADAIDAAGTRKMLELVTALPHGVLGMSPDIEGLVETSTNLAVVKDAGDAVKVLTSTRSSVMTALSAVRQRIQAIGALAGAEVQEKDGYPGWKPDTSSEVLAVMADVYETETGENPEVGAVHAGLECGIIGEKYPGMDMISFGPQIDFPHSPDERVKVPSVEPFWRVLVAALERMAV
ncbi:MAG: aminoacyl-histidine dipeptidase [marine benthic group bacterium]|nr:aminoacyl-histidine dipeptidase [Gemmatimonadota bacterium]